MDQFGSSHIIVTSKFVRCNSTYSLLCSHLDDLQFADIYSMIVLFILIRFGSDSILTLDTFCYKAVLGGDLDSRKNILDANSPRKCFVLFILSLDTFCYKAVFGGDLGSHGNILDRDCLKKFLR